MINPEIEIRFQTFKSIRVAIKGEVRNPQIVKFGLFNSYEIFNFENQLDSSLNKICVSLENFATSSNNKFNQVVHITT